MDFLSIKDFDGRDRDEFCAATRVQKTRQTFDYGEDYTLPDYLPDAKKIVAFTFFPIIETRFLGSGCLEYSGNVGVKVLYSSESGEAANCSFQIPYEGRLEGDELAEGLVDFICPSIVSSSCRLQNLRKMKCSLKLAVDIEVFRRESFMPEVYSSPTLRDKSSVQTLLSVKNGMNVTRLAEDEMKLEDDITIDKNLPDIGEILFSDISIVFDECRSSGNDVICRGCASLSLIYRTGDGKTVSLHRDLPVSESLRLDGAEGGICSCKAFCRMPEITAMEDEFGGMRILSLCESYSLEIMVVKPKEVYICEDAYSTKTDCVVDTSDLSLLCAYDRISGGFSVNESVPLRDIPVSEGSTLVSFMPSCKMSLSPKEGKHGNIAFEGTVSVNCIFSGGDGTLICASPSIPVYYESDRKYKNGCGMEGAVSCRVSDMRVRSDGERLFTDCELSFSALLLSEDKFSAVRSIRLVPSSRTGERSSSTMTLAFPSKEDSLWSIAKKYSVTRETLADENRLKGEELPHMLVISSGD